MPIYHKVIWICPEKLEKVIFCFYKKFEANWKKAKIHVCVYSDLTVYVDEYDLFSDFKASPGCTTTDKCLLVNSIFMNMVDVDRDP